ncbi:unnamed protein product [Cochlearia groenlandica]
MLHKETSRDNSNGYNNNARPRRFSVKRRKVYAVREFPPGCGTMISRLRLRTEPTTCRLNNNNNNNVVASVRSREAKEVENSGRPCNDVNVASKTVESGHGSTKDVSESDELARKRLVLEKSGRPCNDTNVASKTVESEDGPVKGVIRYKVKETLRLFYGACRKLLQEREANRREGNHHYRVDFEASKILKIKGKYLNTDYQIIGAVPGIEVGDEFQYRMELNILGVHRPSQGGIDYVKIDDEVFATSIVASGGYEDELDNSDVLTYTGQGGNVMNANREPEDQQLVTGNLALANSRNLKNPVRVIRGNKKAILEGDTRGGGNYVYDGLYVVEELWQETGSHGKLVYKFKLIRMSGQPELSWKVVKKSKTSKQRHGLCCVDISQGKEKLPICAVNEIDDEKPPAFVYTAKMVYTTDRCKPAHPPKPCGGCTARCTEARNCGCVEKNGGEIPYNHDRAIVCAKNLIYECGPLCKCPSSCYLRVTQNGIKIPLEIFKTESRGWGVRSLASIPSGSFICEYVGEILEEKEAESRTGNDEYLFDIGNNNNMYDNSLLSNLMHDEDNNEETSSQQTRCDVVEEVGGFTIDAAKRGNIGRFINHSCSPNLYAQNVMYDHGDERMPHVMLFAMDNIPPLRELSYHYNYIVDEVRDSDGNIKKKVCYCGSDECSGRLY